jgi:FKBP-type peptidyl-prolyl cis-trans isomerase FklB
MRRMFFALTFLFAAGVARAESYDLSPESNAKFLADFATKPGVIKLKDGLMYRVIKPGNGHGTSPIARQDISVVEYKGWLIDGKVFDATQGEPRRFQTGGVIAGWTEALFKMKTGDEWQVVIPAALAYGDKGRGSIIPPNQTLVFLVRLDSVEYP